MLLSLPHHPPYHCLQTSILPLQLSDPARTLLELFPSSQQRRRRRSLRASAKKVSLLDSSCSLYSKLRASDFLCSLRTCSRRVRDCSSPPLALLRLRLSPSSIYLPFSFLLVPPSTSLPPFSSSPSFSSLPDELHLTSFFPSSFPPPSPLQFPTDEDKPLSAPPPYACQPHPSDAEGLRSVTVNSLRDGFVLLLSPCCPCSCSCSCSSFSSRLQPSISTFPLSSCSSSP